MFPVNPGRQQVFGSKCHGSIRDIDEHVDLAVIATPAHTVQPIIGECVAAGVDAAIIISAGFREIGERGAALEHEVLREARKGKIRVIGPNCLGLMNPHSGLNATFAPSMARPGHIGFISQSGALGTAILDWSQRELVGFSSFVSVGSMLDVGWGDLIQYLGDDPNTRSIVIYMESVGDARSFVSAAREVALSKPIIVLKPGRTEAAAKAAASHTGALTGADDVLDAAFRRCGVIRVDTIAELFDVAEALDKQPRPRGHNLTIVTNAGGPAVLATDVLLANGGRLTELSPQTRERLDTFLPPHWSHQNPIDVIGDAGPERYANTVKVVAEDAGTDGLLLILAPTGLADPSAVASQVTVCAQTGGKPVIASWMGGRDVAPGDAILREAGIPTYPYPDAAARVFQLMWSYSVNLKALYETPASFADEDPHGAMQAPERARETEFIASARAAGRTLLTEIESKNLLAAYGIPTVRTELANTPDQAVEIAAQLGYPVALKLHSRTVTHKTDVGGVRLSLNDDVAVREAFRTIEQSVTQAKGPGHFMGVTVQPMIRREGYELILGSTTDPQFGPILLFGSGGQLVEIYKDRAIGLPPLNTTLARRLMESTKVFPALQGTRGRKSVDNTALETLLVRFSYLIMEQPWIKEIDINPLLASTDGLLALDARVVLHDPDFESPPRPAIRPYPAQYIKPWRFKDGTEIVIRPIRPEDERLIAAFHRKLSDVDVYQRYFHMVSFDQRVAHERLVRVCFGDYDREIALVAEHRCPNAEEPELIAVGRLSKAHLRNEAELATLIVDEYQGRGLGTELFRRLIEIARAEKVDQVNVEILAGNQAMLAICRKLGFSLERVSGGVIDGALPL